MQPNQEKSLTEMAQWVGELLRGQQLRLMTAESCTGGWIAKAVTDIAGSSRWFEGGVVSYSNELKQGLLGVNEAVIQADGAVSEAVVLAMARGGAELAQCEAAISVSGVAGPGGGTTEKPVGLVWFGFYLEGRTWALSQQFSGDREQVRRQCVAFSLASLGHALTQQSD